METSNSNSNLDFDSSSTTDTQSGQADIFSQWNIFFPELGNEIENESQLVKELVASAKIGNFAKVFEIIGDPNKPKKDHLLNCIPEDRRWGVLHQAVYFNNPEIFKKLLRFAVCDSDMRAKRCTSECGDTSGMCALEIARAFKYHKMDEIITVHSNNILAQEMVTFQKESHLGLICNTLAAYKSTFHPKYISPMKSVFEVLRDIFNDMNTNNDRFKAVQKHVCDAMHIVSAKNAEMIEGAVSREDFYQMIVKAYTIEKHHLYTYISTALRRQRSKSYKPTGDDMALGPYAVVYQMLLLFWDKLAVESGTTYRRMKMRQADIDKYVEGTNFIWPAVVSSTTNLDKAQSFLTCETVTADKTIMFIFDNTTRCSWQPKNIEKYARYEENERTYPAGAKFRVKHVTKKEYNETQVSLVLMTQ